MRAAEVSKEFGMNPPTEEENKEETVETEVLEVETETGIKAAVVKTGEKEHQAAAVEEKPGNIEAYDLAKFAMNCLFDNGIIARACFTTENTQMLEKCIEENLDGVTIGKEPKDARDWEAARRALDDIINKYDPSGYMAKAIFPVLMPLKERLDHGERTPELFNQIVESTR